MTLNYFNQHGYLFISKPIRFMSLFISIICFIFSIWMFAGFFVHQRGEAIAYGLVLMIPTLLYLGYFTHRVEFNISEKKLTTSYFGFFRKDYDLTTFYRFEVINYRAMGFISNGSDINMIFNNGNSQYKVSLFKRVNRKKNVEKILNEASIIMDSNSNIDTKSIDEMPI